jgi:hypothetical protein
MMATAGMSNEHTPRAQATDALPISRISASYSSSVQVRGTAKACSLRDRLAQQRITVCHQTVARDVEWIKRLVLNVDVDGSRVDVPRIAGGIDHAHSNRMGAV